jgi:hypothetical protein
MCLNVQYNNYAAGTPIAVNNCDKNLYVNELWEKYSWDVNGRTMYTLCAAYNPALCIQAWGGIVNEAYLKLHDLNELYPNSLWSFYAY